MQSVYYAHAYLLVNKVKKKRTKQDLDFSDN